MGREYGVPDLIMGGSSAQWLELADLRSDAPVCMPRQLLRYFDYPPGKECWDVRQIVSKPCAVLY